MVVENSKKKKVREFGSKQDTKEFEFKHHILLF